jgi:hypothetical protein
MKFEEIFEKEGMYVADSFGEGLALKVIGDTLYNIDYKDKNDISPTVSNQVMYKGLLHKEYTEVFTRQSLFKK